MPLGLSPRESTIGIDQLQQMPTAVVPPVSTGEIVAENIAAPGGGILAGAASTYEAFKSLATNFGAMGGYDPETGSVVEQEPEQVRRQFAIDSAKVVQQFAPDPRRSGAATQVLHGLISSGVRMVGGTLLTGTPIGGAATMALTEGVNTRNEIYAATGDKDLADKLGLGSAMFAGGGALLPGGVGTNLMTRVLSGTGIQITAGVANRAMMHTQLEDAGFTDMAKQYLPLDGAALMADGILGAGFGALHHMFAPALTDSARAIKDAEHAERASPGIPDSPQSRQESLDSLSRSIDALIRGDDTPPPTGDVRYVPDAAQERVRAAAEREIADARDEAIGKPVEAPIAREMTPDEIKAIQDRVDAAQATGSKLGRSARAAEQAKTENETLAALDDQTREALVQARDAVKDMPDLEIAGEGDKPIRALDSLRQAVEDLKQTASDEELHRVVLACGSRI